MTRKLTWKMLKILQKVEINDETTNKPTENVTENGVDPEPVEVPEITLLHPNVKTSIEQYISGFGISDYIFKMSAASEKGENFSGLIGRLEINGLKNGTPLSLNWIVKTAPRLETYRNFLNIEKIYNREVYIYTQLFPLFKSFQAKNLEPFDNYPEYILSSLASMEETIVMQDMKSIGYVLRDRQRTLDLEHVKLVMKAYGKLHALSFALKTLNHDSWQWVKSNTRKESNKTVIHTMQKPFMGIITTILHPENDGRYLKKFSDNFIDVYLDLDAKPSDYEVIIHGDCWINNMLWKYQAEKPEKVCLLDWQLSNCGSPASDLTNFLFTSTSKEFRDKHYESMLRLYHYSLCEHLNEFGVKPELHFPFEALKNEMKTYAVLGLFYSLFLLGIITKKKDETTDISGDFLTPAQKSEVDFKTRARGVVIDFYDKGYLDCL